MKESAIIQFFATGALIMHLATSTSRGVEDFGKYIWEFPAAENIRLPTERTWMLDDLRVEVDKILAAGHLAPYYFNSGDLAHEGYFLYVAPGRIITTLAWAYPHLTPKKQAEVKQYVATELDSAKFAPWSGKALPPYEGTGREGLGKPKSFNFERWWGMEGHFRPFLHPYYGLWLYAYRTGDWAPLAKHWSDVKAFYHNNSAKAELYGELGAHLAMARIARHFNDSGMENEAVNRATNAFEKGKDFGAMEKISINYFNRLKEKRHDYPAHTAFMMMNLSPEVGRFLKDQVNAPTIQKNESLRKHWTLWWLIAPPYSGTWAGNIGVDCEGIGCPRELFGMIYPVERWVAEIDPNILSGYMTGGPDGLGDCYWLEPLVWTIEAHGTTRWIDVRKE